MIGLFNKAKCGACYKTKYFTKRRTITPKRVLPEGMLVSITSDLPLCRKCFKAAKKL